MRLHNVLTITQAQLFSPDAIPDIKVCSGFGADLMSDVLCYNVAQGMLITRLINPQIVRTAEMADASAILRVRDKRPLPETIALARQIGLPIPGMFDGFRRDSRVGVWRWHGVKNIQRCVDEMMLESVPGQGTRLEMKIYLHP